MRAAAAAERLVRCCRIDLIAGPLHPIPPPLPSPLYAGCGFESSTELFESDGKSSRGFMHGGFFL